MSKVPISVLIAVKNEEENLARCLSPIKDWVDEIIIVDSQSTDSTISIAESYKAEIIQFYYKGGWPKKRQWALNTYKFRNDWILLLDADEILDIDLKKEIEKNILTQKFDGFYIPLEIVFLNKRLKYGGFIFYKLCLFRKGKGCFEKRISNQTIEMSDIEVHEHIKVTGQTGYLKNAIEHYNINSLFRYIQKHNEYSTWEAEVIFQARYGMVEDGALTAKLIGGNQAQRRRWLKNKFILLPGFSVITFLYHYFLRLGFLDGKPGLLYCGFKAVQRFQTKAKFYELMQQKAKKINEL